MRGIISALMGAQSQMIGVVAWLSATSVAKWLGEKLLLFFMFSVVLPLVLVKVSGYLASGYIDNLIEYLLDQDTLQYQLSALSIWMIDKLQLIETVATILTIGFTSRIINRVTI